MEKMSPEVKAAYDTANEAYEEYSKIKSICQVIERDWFEKKMKFERLDYEAALTDGRLKVIPARAKAEPKQAALTMAQILVIAERLGVKIEEE